MIGAGQRAEFPRARDLDPAYAVRTHNGWASGPSASSRPCRDARTAPVKPASLRNGPLCFEDARNKVRRSDGMMMGRASSLPDCTSSSTEKYGRMLDAAPRLTKLFIAEIERTS